MGIMNQLTNQEKLTFGEKKVADYILKHPEEVILLTVTALADNANTSLATVLRLIKKLGYKTFGEFKLELTVSLVKKNNNEKASDDSTIDEIIYSLEDMKKNINLDQLKKCSELITSSKKILIYGYGASYSVAYFLYFKLMKIGIETSIINNSYEGIALANNSNESTAIIISGSGSSSTLGDFLKLFKKNKNNHAILISNMRKSPLGILSDYTISAGKPDDQMNSGAAYSRIPMLVIAEYLCNVVVSDKELKSRLISTNHELSKKDY